MILFYQPAISEGVLHLDEEESRHCVKVLRKSNGDLIRITDGLGYFYDALITKADPKQCGFSIQARHRQPTKSHYIHIAISPTKNADRIEWFVEKTVEIGVDEITLMECDNTERSHIKSSRLKKVAVSAMKQSLKADLPIINDVKPFTDVLKMKNGSGFIAYVDASNPLHLQQAAKGFKNAIVLIGPEGDFSQQELSLSLNAGFQKVNLGKSRLRTETAGMAACHILNLVHE